MQMLVSRDQLGCHVLKLKVLRQIGRLTTRAQMRQLQSRVWPGVDL